MVKLRKLTMIMCIREHLCKLNRRVLWFLSVVLLAGVLCGCQTHPDGVIDYKQGLSCLTGRPLRQGDRFTNHIILKSDLKMLFPHADYKESELLLDLYVKSVDKQGQAVIEVTITSLKSLENTFKLKFVYDSEDEAGAEKSSNAKANQQKKYVGVFAALKGCKYIVVVDVKNRTVELTEMDQALKGVACGVPDGDMFGGDQAKMLFNEGILKEYVWPTLFAGSDAKSASAGTVLVPGASADKIQRIYVVEENKSPEKSMPYKITGLSNEEQVSPPDIKKAAKPSGRQFQIASIQGEGSYTFAAGESPVLKMQEKMFVKMESSAKAQMGYVIEKTVEIKCGRK
jgi:hypothetical protein